MGFDPTPGDPQALDAAVRVLREAVGALSEAVTVLRGVGDDEVWRGSAAVAFRAMVDGELRPHVEIASQSFEGALRALGGWLSAMDTAQAYTRRLESQAALALAELTRAQSLLGGLDPTTPLPASASVEGAQVYGDQVERAGLQRKVGMAQEQLDSVRASARRHAEDYQTQADHVAAALDQAAGLAPNEPGWLDRALGGVGSAVRDSLDTARDFTLGFLGDNAPFTAVLGEVLGVVSLGLGILAFFPPFAFLALPAVLVGLAAVGVQYAAIAGKSSSLTAPFKDGQWQVSAASVVAGGGAYRATTRVLKISGPAGGTKMVPQRIIGRDREVPVGMFEAARKPFALNTEDFVTRTVRLKLVQSNAVIAAAQLPSAGCSARDFGSWMTGSISTPAVSSR